MKLTEQEELAMYLRTEFPNETELSWPVAAALRRTRKRRTSKTPVAVRPEPARTGGLTTTEAPGD